MGAPAPTIWGDAGHHNQRPCAGGRAREQRGVPVRACRPRSGDEPHRRAVHPISARRHLGKSRVVIFPAAALGNATFFLDRHRGSSAGGRNRAEVILLAKNVDGVSDSDPAKNPNAKNMTTFPTWMCLIRAWA